MKTHLNYIRSFPSRTTQKYYVVSNELYKSIINYDINYELFDLYILGRKGQSYYWEPREKCEVSFIDYRSFEIYEYNLLFSYFRIKALETIILLPSDNNYRDFKHRVMESTKRIKPALQYVSLQKAIKKGSINIRKVQPMEFKYYNFLVQNQMFFHSLSN